MTKIPKNTALSATLREARRSLTEDGALPAGLLDPQLERSWQRSLTAGLSAAGRATGTPHASARQLTRAREEQHELLAHARPAMAFLFEQTRDTDSIVLLSDAQGMLLDALGDPGFASRAERVALRPGANWNEQWRGTNAVGTALAEERALVVRGGEHFLERNGFLTCAAAPIFDPRGQLAGAIDISGDHRQFHRHTLGLARSAARMIEHRLFETRCRHSLRLRFHPQREGVGGLTEGLIALSEDGWLIGANQVALSMLTLTHHDIGARRLEQCFELTLPTLLALGRHHRDTLFEVRDGERRQTLWMRMESASQGIDLFARVPAGADPGPDRPGTPSLATLPPISTAFDSLPVNDALERLNTGELMLQQALTKTQRAMAASISLVLQGESGVGRQSFARAAHASGPWRNGPFIAVNCTTLTDTQLERELFGQPDGPGRLQAARGGALFLSDVNDLPLSVQARLVTALAEAAQKPDFWLISSTRLRLREVVDSGRLREDLHARLNGLTLRLPALRERQDLPALLERLLREAAPRSVHMSPAVVRALVHYRWPGNLRQLINVVQAACALLADDEDTIDWGHLPDDLIEDLRSAEAHPDALSASPPGPLSEVVDPQRNLRALSTPTVQRTVDACGGNLSEAARRLGISRNTLYRKLRVSPATP